MATIEVEDIQGIVLQGYGHLKASQFALLEIVDPSAARSWLKEIAAEVAVGEQEPASHAVNLAFTYEGLQRLSIDGQVLAEFAPEFREGMTHERRRRFLGDDRKGHTPEEWRWGGPGDPIHVLLLLYAPDPPALSDVVDSHRGRWEAAKLVARHNLGSVFLPDFKEHFGFRDGIAQPLIAGQSKQGPARDTVAAGEFLLGYLNEQGEMPGSPRLPPEIAKNGSYLVFRHLSQDVHTFWKFVDRFAKDAEDRDLLAAKIVGRRRDGTPLVSEPGGTGDNDFGFTATDAAGLACPIGSHIRRANPRDMLSTNARDLFDVARKHRILRRGRPYGEPVAKSMDPADILATPVPDLSVQDASAALAADRGLYFICLNANIAGQYEFIQQTWLNNPKFFGLYNQVDPLVGPQEASGAEFIIQQEPVRRRLREVPSFVRVRGGAYFFLPGRSALAVLAAQ